MIDKDELRIARRTAERNGYTVLPPREDDERDLDRFRQRQREREDARTGRPMTSRRFRDEIDDYEEERRPQRSARYLDDEPEKQTRFRPLRRDTDEDDDYVPARKPVSRQNYRDDFEPQRKPVRPEIDLETARKTMEDNGYEVRKLSRLDQAKRVAQNAGFDVRKISDLRTQNTNPAPTAGGDEGNDRPPRRVATRDGEPIRRPVVNREFSHANRDAIRTRTAPDTEINKTNPQPTQTQAPTQEPPKETPVEAPKKPSFEDDYVNRAAAFFDDDE